MIYDENRRSAHYDRYDYYLWSKALIFAMIEL